MCLNISRFSVESANNLESIRESYINTVNELNQELLVMKEAYEQLDAEKQLLSNELDRRPLENGQSQGKQTIGILLLFYSADHDICFLFRTSTIEYN